MPLLVNAETGALKVEAEVSADNGGVEERLDISNAALAAIDAKVGVAPAADSSSHGIGAVRYPALSNTASAIKAAPGNILGYTLINPASSPVYIKFFNTAHGSVTVGSTAVVETIMVPANDGTDDGQFVVVPGAFPCMERFTTAISVAAVSGREDSNNVAPASGVYAKIYFA